MFYLRDAQGNEDGPHSVETLTQRLAEGALTLFTIARREDQKRWRSLGSFTEFARAKTRILSNPNTLSPVPPAPPVRQARSAPLMPPVPLPPRPSLPSHATPPPLPDNPPPVPVFDPTRRVQQKRAETNTEEGARAKATNFFSKWIWRVWSILLCIRFLLWLGDENSASLGLGKLLSLLSGTLIFPCIAAGWVLKNNPENRNSAALAFFATYLIFWILT